MFRFFWPHRTQKARAERTQEMDQAIVRHHELAEEATGLIDELRKALRTGPPIEKQLVRLKNNPPKD